MTIRIRHLIEPEPAARRGSRLPSRARRGQALVEFAAVLLPVLLIVVGIIQFGLLFGANVSITNAAREGARAATIHVFRLDPPNTRFTNDIARCTSALRAARQAFGLANPNAPSFSTTSECQSGQAADLNGDGLHDRWTNGDLVVSLCRSMATPSSPCPDAGVSASHCTYVDAAGCLVQVRLTYRSDIIVPFLPAILPTDPNGRFVQHAVATMVVN